MRAAGGSMRAGGSRHNPGLLASLVLAALLAVSGAPARAESRLVEELAYAGGDPAARSLDLFLPDAPDAPLFVFVHSSFWDRVTKGRDIARRLARPLQRAGAAVAIVRHRLAPEHTHPAAAQDVAAAIAFLVERAAEYGYDAGQLYLAGHSSGAHLAALVSLDAGYLAAHGLAPDRISGVAAWSGVYDLDPPKESISDEEIALYTRAFGARDARRSASPLNHARGDAPLFLLMVAQHDLPGAAEGANRFGEALRSAGHPATETFYLGGRDHWSALDLTGDANPARRHLLAMLRLDESFGSIEDLFGTRRFWRDPSFSTAEFWEDEKHVAEHAPDERFLQTLNMQFAKPGLPRPLRPARYYALPLLDYVARHAAGSGDFLSVRNARGEQVVWRVSEIAAYRPVIVIGLDDQRELFRLADVYHTRRRYTWKQSEDEPWVLARPLGAFVHFLDPPPARVDPKLFGRFGLQADAFALSETDPLLALRDLPAPEQALLTETFRCISCHRFRDAGARAGHLRARDGELVGGFALPLEEYPPKAWRRYCFEQGEVAGEIGATPVALGEHARTLFELVERERRR